MLQSQEQRLQKVCFQSSVELPIIVVSSERIRENYAEISAVAIKQAFTVLQDGPSNFMDNVFYILV